MDLTAILAAGVATGTILVFAAIGEILAERSGVLNLGVEGMMLIGAVAAFSTALSTGNPWLGVAMAIEAGLTICAPVHDALLLEAPLDRIGHDATQLAQIMADASEIVLGQRRRVRVETQIIRWPDRFEDETRGSKMFATILAERL